MSHVYKFLLTNVRSLSPKIHSLHTAFVEHELDFALVTESWLKDGSVLDNDVIDLEWGTNLKILYKNRTRNSAGRRKVGGGVSIVFDKSRCNLRERKIGGNKFELLLAVGRVGKIPRQAAIFCLYLEPRLKVGELAEICDIISREILMLKARGDPLIFIGGDLNRKCLDEALQDFPDVVQINHDPTRGGACLDILNSNAPDLSVSSWPPLETRDGTRSDHLCIVFSGEIKKERDFHWIRKTARKHTEAAMIEYGTRLRTADWDLLLPPNLGPDDLVSRFEEWNTAVTDELFPMRTTRCRSNEKPWITDGIRRLSRQKKRVYKREGKSRLWWTLEHRMVAMLADSSSTFVDNITNAGANAKKFFSTVKSMGSVAKGSDWCITDLFPGATELEAGEEAAAYFTRITDLFQPVLPPTVGPGDKRREITLEEVEKRLKQAKKPNSVVKGDLLPRVMKAHHKLLAYPVMKIFNAVFNTGAWPTAWKTETTVIIPKVPTPESLADCRNISCTPFLSKVLEGVLLDDMRSEIPIDLAQYGGIKNSSVDHLLVDLFETVLEPLEQGCPSLVLGIDFEKAFNRLDHGECLSQLAQLGASKPSIALTNSFLAGRSMRVRVGSNLSRARALLGGSPQGSILGCYLYGAATQRLNLDLPRTPADANTPPPAVNNTAGSPPQGRHENQEGFDLLPDDVREVSTSSEDSFHTAADEDSMSDREAGLLVMLMAMFKYVDDTTVTELVPANSGIRHVSSAAPTELIPAVGTRSFMLALIRAAAAMGM